MILNVEINQKEKVITIETDNGTFTYNESNWIEFEKSEFYIIYINDCEWIN